MTVTPAHFGASTSRQPDRPDAARAPRDTRNLGSSLQRGNFATPAGMIAQRMSDCSATQRCAATKPPGRQTSSGSGPEALRGARWNATSGPITLADAHSTRAAWSYDGQKGTVYTVLGKNGASCSLGAEWLKRITTSHGTKSAAGWTCLATSGIGKCQTKRGGIFEFTPKLKK